MTNHNRIFFKLLILCLSILSCDIKHNYSSENGIPTDTILLKVVRDVSTKYEPGSVPTSWSEEKYKNDGFATCAQYAQILQNNLLKIGVPSRLWSITTFALQFHGLVEVFIKNKWVLVDPTIGIVYKNSFFEILKNPSLANRYIGSPFLGRGDTYGSSFFEKTAVINSDLNLSFLSDNIGLIDSNDIIDESKIRLEINGVRVPFNESFIIKNPLTVSIKWPHDISPPSFLSLNFTNSIRIENKKSEYINLNNSSAVIYAPHFINSKNEILLLVTKNSLEATKLQIRPWIKRTDADIIVKSRVPNEALFLFEGRKENIDSMKVICGNTIAWALDIGDVNSENLYWSYLFSRPNTKERNPDNWSELFNENNISYRTTEWLGSKGDTLVRFLPLADISSSENCSLEIRHKTYSNEINFKNFSLYLKSYGEQQPTHIADVLPAYSWVTTSILLSNKIKASIWKKK